MRLVLAAVQGATFGIIAMRLAGSDSLRLALYGAIAFPLVSMIASVWWPRFAAVLGLLLVGLWGATCGFMAYEDPSLEAWEWVPAFAFLGLLFGAGANSYLFRDVEELEWEPGCAEPQRRRGTHGSAGSPGGRPPSPPPPYSDAHSDPWSILGLARGARPGEVRRAFRARMAEYHPDKVATLGAELRELAERKSKETTAAYAALGGR